MLPSSYSKHFLDGSMTEGDNCAALMDYCRTSDDSGLTSDSSGAMTAAACIMTRSTAPSITSTKSPRTKKRDARVNHRAERGEEVMSSATDCSPYDEAAKPISVNRKLSKNTTKVNNVERSNDEETKTDRSSIERDSLDSHSGDDGYNEYVEEEEEIFEKVKRTNEPFSTLMLKRVPKTIIQDIPSPEYVNLQDMVNSKIINNHYSSIQEQFKPSIRDTHNYDSPIIKRDVPQYADIIKDRTHIPNIKNPVERRLHEMAEKCLSIVDTIDGQTPNQHFDANTSSLNFFNSSLSFGDHNNDQSKKNSQTMSLCSVTQLNNINNNESPNNMRNGSIKISPAVSGISSLRTSLIPGRDNYEKQGNLIQMSDNRLKSIKRRFFVLKNGTLSMYKSQKSLSREEEPTFTFTLKDIKSIVRINNKSGVKGIQITTTEQVLSQSLRNLTITDLTTKDRGVNSIISGWMHRVKHGHQKKLFVSLVDQKLLFFKKAEDKIPNSQIYLHGALVSEKGRTGSSDDYSGSSDENTASDIQTGELKAINRHPMHNKGEYSICIEVTNQDPVYLIVNSIEEKEKWLYYLKVASRDATLVGTSFEILLQRILLKGSENINYILFDDLLLKPSMKEIITDPLNTIDNKVIAKKAIEMDRAIHLFCTVSMKPIAVQYHIDLAQNILTTAMEDECLKNELYSQLIRMTNGSINNSGQAWRLLALSLPIFLPKQYALLWFLKQHIRRWSNIRTDYLSIVCYCEKLLEHCIHALSRLEPPSKFETKIILCKDISIATSMMPFSIAVLLPSGDYQVVEFNGATEIGHCLSSLCLRLNLRPALLSGYALYLQDPLGTSNDLILLKGKQRLCDCISAWENKVIVNGKGKVVDKDMPLQLRMRHYWRHLQNDETIMEQLFLCHRMGEEIVKGQIPISNELGEELCALYGQMVYGDFNECFQLNLEEILTKFYPKKLLDVMCSRSLKSNVSNKWYEFKELSVNDCVRMILCVLKKWKLFGSFMRPAQMKLPFLRNIFITINDYGIHLLAEKQLDIIKSIPLQSIISFGEYNGDFMLTLIRQVSPNAHPDETPRERLTFTMEPKSIEQLTLHLAELIRCQKLIWKLSINY
uniref:PH domain-containing protein n=1 Tax=Rhabditophanes sp. KR3021 TaxID=114890 RepID=A0AC35UIG4_9BILA